jgi:3-phosphoshikimate 1-carboxyvinyltransferase
VVRLNKQIEIETVDNVSTEITAPPSKAHSLRAIFIASLAEGISVIKNPLLAEDQMLCIEALRNMGVVIDISENESKLTIKGVGGNFKITNENIFIGNSGVAARTLTVIGSLADKDFIIDGTERMRDGRPLQDLIDSIKNLGIEAHSINNNGCPPILLKHGTFKGGETSLKGNKSSQYFSAILLASPFAQKETVINTIGDMVSKPYIDITLEIMKEFGVRAKNENYNKFTIEPNQKYKAINYNIEGDYSSASFFFAAAAITKGRIKINNLNPNSKQGDKFFLNTLEKMGCLVNYGKDYVEVIGKPLKGITVDMKDYPDIVPPLAVVCAFAKGESKLYNISHLKYKECDRLIAPVKELNKIGVDAKCDDDSITIIGDNGKNIHGATIDTYNDHRMVMSFACAGLKIPNIIINNPENVNKSFPDFFEKFNKLYEVI